MTDQEIIAEAEKFKPLADLQTGDNAGLHRHGDLIVGLGQPWNIWQRSGEILTRRRDLEEMIARRFTGEGICHPFAQRLAAALPRVNT